MTIATRAMAEGKTFGQRPYRVAIRRQSLGLQNMTSICHLAASARRRVYEVCPVSANPFDRTEKSVPARAVSLVRNGDMAEAVSATHE
jgi:hypothetical protein